MTSNPDAIRPEEQSDGSNSGNVPGIPRRAWLKASGAGSLVVLLGCQPTRVQLPVADGKKGAVIEVDNLPKDTEKVKAFVEYAAETNNASLKKDKNRWINESSSREAVDGRVIYSHTWVTPGRAAHRDITWWIVTVEKQSDGTWKIGEPESLKTVE